MGDDFFAVVVDVDVCHFVAGFEGLSGGEFGEHCFTGAGFSIDRNMASGVYRMDAVGAFKKRRLEGFVWVCIEKVFGVEEDRRGIQFGVELVEDLLFTLVYLVKAYSFVFRYITVILHHGSLYVVVKCGLMHYS